MTQRALIVGLGAVLPHLAQPLQAAFGDDDSQDIRGVWLHNQAAPADLPAFIEPLALTLDYSALSDLYYRPGVRAWSGANWRDWRGALVSNPLYGKLAAHYYQARIRAVVQAQIGALTATQTEQPPTIHFYVLAALHDPLANGALLDVAYLLNDIGKVYPSRVYGILLLPGTRGDPLHIPGADAESEARNTRAQHALTYVGLRELQFALGKPSFYQNHHDEVWIDVRDESPFRFGDCYLLGGTQNERGQSIEWPHLAANIVQFIHLQTTTELGSSTGFLSSIPGSVASFGVGDPNIQRSQTMRARLDSILAEVLPLMLDVSSAGELPLPDMPRLFTLDLLSVDARAVFDRLNALTQENRPYRLFGGRGTQTDLGHYDAHFEAMSTLLRQYERDVNERRTQQVRLMRQSLADELLSLRQAPNVTFQGLFEAQTVLLRDANRRRQDAASALNSARTRATRAAARVQQAREDALYAGRSYPFVTRLALPVLLLLLPMGILLGRAALPITALAWVLGAGLLPLLIASQLQNARYRRTQTAFAEALRAFLLAQYDLIEKRAQDAYARQMADTLAARLRIQAAQAPSVRDHARTLGLTDQQPARIQYLRAALSHIHQAEHSSPDTLTLDERERLREYRPTLVRALLARLWAWLDDDLPLTEERLQAALTEIIEQDLLIELDQDDAYRLQAVVNNLSQNAGTLLRVSYSQIPEALRGNAVTLVGLRGYHTRAVQQVSDAVKGSRVQLVPLSSPQAQNGSVLRRMALGLHLQKDILLTALPELDIWRQAYKQTIRLPGRAQSHRSFLHPTRAGVASPDLRRYDQIQGYTLLIKAFCVLLHLHPVPLLEESLCDILYVNSDPRADFDELCGALYEAPEVLLRRFRSALNPPATADDEPPLARLRRVWQRLADKRPRFSEAYADWEVETIERIETLLQRDQVPNGLRVLENLMLASGIWESFLQMKTDL